MEVSSAIFEETDLAVVFMADVVDVTGLIVVVLVDMPDLEINGWVVLKVVSAMFEMIDPEVLLVNVAVGLVFSSVKASKVEENFFVAIVVLIVVVVLDSDLEEKGFLEDASVIFEDVVCLVFVLVTVDELGLLSSTNSI